MSTVPNVFIFCVDDLGFNQVGYHAKRVGNEEILTPRIDQHVLIELDRGYMTPWCGPSRAALQTGRTNSYNANVSHEIFAFDQDIGYVGGLPPGTKTLAIALKNFGRDNGTPYKAYYNGKWGIGGGSWANTPLAMGYDHMRGNWGDWIDACDGWIPLSSSPPKPQEKFGSNLYSALPGYWEQNVAFQDAPWCDHLATHENLTDWEALIGCKTQPRTTTKHVDLDLLDKVTEQILQHDYDEGPFLQFFATQSMHIPMQYPQEYDLYSDLDIPDYMRYNDRIKPPASPDDMRLATSNHLRFVDDLFGDAMEAIKDAGQWNNTIVFFTSDNGGAILKDSVNNNFPLRGAKFSMFEGGIRVPQFFAGGWIENQLGDAGCKEVPATSDTYFFPNDIAPTLLKMVGANKKYLIDDLEGAPYGNEMWAHIKNSITGGGPHQKPRKVSFSHDMFFHVKSETQTYKNFFYGNKAVPLPRLWAPVWPRDGDLITDNGYKSMKPCRPDGVALDCCSFLVSNDEQESIPLNVNCEEIDREARTLFDIEGGCEKESRNPLCLVESETIGKVSPSDLSLWTHFGAGGPFLSSSGKPINNLPMKCACFLVDGHRLHRKIINFSPTYFTPMECFQDDDDFDSRQQSLDKRLVTSVDCDISAGLTFHRPPRLVNNFASFSTEGVNATVLKQVAMAEQAKMLALQLQNVVAAVTDYGNRSGHLKWPSPGRFPFITQDYDSCLMKGITSVPTTVNTLTPYMFATGDPTKLTSPDDDPFGLCVPYKLDTDDMQFFCPTVQNNRLKAVRKWVYRGDNAPYGVFEDGEHWFPLTMLECSTLCHGDLATSPYIGSGARSMLGVVVDHPVPDGAASVKGREVKCIVVVRFWCLCFILILILAKRRGKTVHLIMS